MHKIITHFQSNATFPKNTALNSFPIEIVDELKKCHNELPLHHITHSVHRLFCQKVFFYFLSKRHNFFGARDTLNLWSEILSIVCDCFCAVSLSRSNHFTWKIRFVLVKIFVLRQPRIRSIIIVCETFSLESELGEMPRMNS